MNLTNRNFKKDILNEKRAIDVSIGDYISINGDAFMVHQIDVLSDKLCFVDKYACDHYVPLNSKIELLEVPIQPIDNITNQVYEEME